MVTITQIIQWQVHQQAQRIQALKTAAITRQAREKYAYASPDGALWQDQPPTPEQRADGWELKEIRYEIITGHMSPRHADWRQYATARREASLLLTARLLLKLGGGVIPEFAEVHTAIGAGKLNHHAKRGKARQITHKAYRYLRKIANRLERRPERFQAVTEWLQSRQMAGATQGNKEDAYV